MDIKRFFRTLFRLLPALTQEHAKAILKDHEGMLVSQWSEPQEVKERIVRCLEENYKPCGAQVIVRRTLGQQTVEFTMIIFTRASPKYPKRNVFTQRLEKSVKRIV